MNEEPIAVTLLVVEALETLQIRYLLSGSLASAFHGNPRATRDADILADMQTDHVQAFCKMLEPEFNVAAETIQNALRHRSSFNVIHYDSVFKIDIFIPKTKFDEQELQRRTLVPIAVDPEKFAYVATAEDIVLSKLNCLGNEVSEQQWRDVLGVFKANEGKLDLEYMKRNASDLGRQDLLQKLVPT